MGKWRLQFSDRNLVFILVLVGSVTFARVLLLGFTHWDDNLYVIDNPFIRSLSPASLKALFTHTLLGNYAPFHLLSYSFDFQLWGLDPRGYHLTNLLWHLLVGIGVFYLVFMISKKKNIAWLTAILFTIHPINVETVAWIAQRKTLIAQFFAVLAFIEYIHFVGGSEKKHFAASILFFFCSLLSKVSTITLPVLLVLYDYCFLNTFSRRSLVHKIPYFMISGVFVIIAFWAQFVAYGGELKPHGGSLLSNLYTMIVVVKNYITLLLFPLNLSAYYYFSYHSLMDPQVFLSILLLLAVAISLFLLRKKRTIMFWAGWFFVALLPNMHIVPLDAVMGDRYMYFPAVGLFVLLSLSVDKMRYELKDIALGREIVLTGVMVCCGIFAYLSFQRIGVWKSDLTLWAETIKTSPSPVAYNNLATYWGREGDFFRSKEYFERALESDPDNYQANKNLGSLSMINGDLYNAEIYYQRALSLKPGMATLKLEMGSMYIEKGNHKKARDILNEIPANSPYYQEAQKRLARILRVEK